MMQEQWKAIEGYEGLYTISNQGRIKSCYVAKLLKGWAYGKKEYPAVSLHKDGKLEKIFIHLLVARHFVPNPLGLPEVNHMDTDVTNFRADNLEWTDRSGNMLHAPTYLLMCADTNPKRVKKLTKEQADLMKHDIAKGRDKHSIAETFGVHYSYVCMVARGERRVAP